MALQSLRDDNGTPTTPFLNDLKGVLQRLRAAFTELFVSVGADPSRPQDVSRRFGLNKNLTWKLSKVVGNDLRAAVHHVPGSGGIEILPALEKHGAQAPALDNARAAVADFDRLVSVHTGDRATLELMINSMPLDGVPGDGLEQARRLAFQGNSATWGVQAEVQMALNIMAPNEDDPAMVDLVQVAGLVNFWRLRPDARWLLFRRETWDDVSLNDAPPRGERALDATRRGADDVPLLPEFCSSPTPLVDVVKNGQERRFELPPGPVGTAAAITCTYGVMTRAAGTAYQDKRNTHSELGVTVVTPVQTLLFDLLVHDDLQWAMDPEVALYGRLDGGQMHAAGGRERNRLPILETVQELGRGVVAISTPIVPHYRSMADSVFRTVGWDPSQFHAYRFEMRYPPIPSTALLVSELLPRRSEDAETGVAVGT